MKILITGGKGRLGSRLVDEFQKRGFSVDSPGRDQVDWSSAVSANKFIQNGKYGLIVGCAAYTKVAKAEANRGKCHADTYSTAFVTAKIAKLHDIPFVYISSDYVIPLLKGEPGGVYAKCKLLAEGAVLRHHGTVIRVSFTTVEQAQDWRWVNAYSVANRWWVDDAVPELCKSILDAAREEITAIGPEDAVTPEQLLTSRFPDHPALRHRVVSPEQMLSLVGYAAPKDSRFFH